jgi:putative ABC transport system ATP-binding protein
LKKESLIKSLKGKVMNKNEIVSLSNIQKKIQDKPIFSIHAFTVSKGDFVTIKGVSGSGKTTLLNILGMNDTVSSGEYLFEGVETAKLKAKEKLKIKRNKISFLFQDFGLVEEETINFNLEIGLKYSKLSRKEKVKQKKEALNAVNLNKKLSTTISSLSGGEKQRVALARIILKPSILILADEPTGSLDSLNRDIVTDILFQQSIDGKAVIIVTHDEELAKKGNKTIEL